MKIFPSKRNLVLSLAWIWVLLPQALSFVSIDATLEERTNEILEKRFPLAIKSEYITALTTPESLHTVATMDVGSTGTRILVMRIDDNGNQRELFRGRFNTEFHISENTLDLRLAQLVALSEWLTEEFGPMHKVARATAGFRQAGAIAEKLAQLIRDFTDIDFEIISQHTEALLAFNGVQKSPGNAHRIIIDMGGGSGQIMVAQPNGQLDKIVTTPCGANILLKHFLHDIKQDPTLDHLFPTTPDEIESAIAIAKECLLGKTMTLPNNTLSHQDGQWSLLKEHVLKDNGNITGIGLFHQRGVVAHIDKNKTGYTKEDLLIKIYTLCLLDLETARRQLNVEDPRHPWVLSDLVLALALLELLEIKHVHLSNKGNLEGIFFDFLEKKACNSDKNL